MGFWDAYRASLKSRDVEEPIDYWLHRPLGYVVAKLSFPTPISPDAITVGSIVLGVAGAACVLTPFAYHMQVAGLLVFLSIVFDCADGQLARMRKTSSVFGRALDGSADLIVSAAVVAAAMYFLWQRYHSPLWLGVTVLGLAALTAVTSSFHTTMFDHYKNVWMYFLGASYVEGETLAEARARYDAMGAETSRIHRAAMWFYLIHVKGQEDYLKGFDPHTRAITQMPAYTPERGEIYRKHAGRAWALNRSLFGFGSMIGGLAVALAAEALDVYLLLRLVVLNGLFYLVLGPMQRRASRAAMEEMAATAAPEA